MPRNSAETPECKKPTKVGIYSEHAAEELDRRLSVAPMMDWTDRHCRYFLRGFSPRVLLYTEMITAQALARGDRNRLLRHTAEERPLALQLGGSEPALLADAARAGADAGYDEINLNCGCPSDRVHAGAFGACLMREPGTVADCVAAMRAAVAVPVTVKMRIGVVEGAGALAQMREFTDADFGKLREFTARIVQAGCGHVTVHARKAVLGGLSPRENREVPPLRFDVVERLKREFPQISIGLNGGLRTAEQCSDALGWADAVMLGREAYHRPGVLAELHQRVFDPGWQAPTNTEQLERMARYAEHEVGTGEPLSAITRHMLGLYSGQPGARRFRQWLSTQARTVYAPAGAARVLREAASLYAA